MDSRLIIIPGIKGLAPPVHLFKLALKLLAPLYHLSDLIGIQEIEEFEHADLAVLDLAEQWKREHAYQRDHSDRDERDQVHEQLRLIRGLYRVLLDVVLLDKT
jgi:hypothetical protein